MSIFHSYVNVYQRVVTSLPRHGRLSGSKAMSGKTSTMSCTSSCASAGIGTGNMQQPPVPSSSTINQLQPTTVSTWFTSTSSTNQQKQDLNRKTKDSIEEKHTNNQNIYKTHKHTYKVHGLVPWWRNQINQLCHGNQLNWWQHIRSTRSFLLTSPPWSNWSAEHVLNSNVWKIIWFEPFWANNLKKHQQYEVYPIGSMVLLYMVTWIPSIYPLYVSINIPAPWIRHGFLVFHGFAHQTDTQRRVHSYNDVVMFRRSSRVDAMKIFFPSGPSGHGSHLGVSHHHLTYG